MLLNYYDLNLVNEGQILRHYDIQPDQKFDVKLFPGASGGGWVAFLISKGVPTRGAHPVARKCDIGPPDPPILGGTAALP